MVILEKWTQKCGRKCGHEIELNLTFSTNGTTFVRGQILFVYWTAWIVTAKLIACNGSIVT